MRRGAIYSVASYANWHTVMSPVVFVLHPGTDKLHALALNDPRMTQAEATQFAGFIKRMRNVPGVENYSGAVLYRILKTYYPGIVRKTYRTYFTSLVGRYSLVSYGLVPDRLFTDLEKTVTNSDLAKKVKNQQVVQAVSEFSVKPPKLDKPSFFVPGKTPAPPPISAPSAPSAPKIPSAPSAPGTGLEGYE